MKYGLSFVLFWIAGLLLSVPPLSIPQLKVHRVSIQDTSLTQLRCLTEAIYYEARDEPYDAQLGVATVVMNRVHHSDFPNSVCEVVYQRSSRGCQFSWVCEPHAVNEPREYQKAERLALTVLGHHYKLSSVRYALFFHTTEVSPAWDKNMQLMDSIGVQLFYGPIKDKGIRN